MARITVEDCIEVFPNRFDVVLFASQRARDIELGSPLNIDRENDKNTVVALREIAEGYVKKEEVEEAIVKRYQKLNSIDEEDKMLLSLQEDADESLETSDEDELLAALKEAMGDDMFSPKSEG